MSWLAPIGLVRIGIGIVRMSRINVLEQDVQLRAVNEDCLTPGT